MNCPFPDETLKAVVSYLRRTGQTIACEEGAYLITKGRPNSAVIAQACADGAVTLSVDGSLLVCGTQILTELDTAKIRRRVEDHLRKVASKQDIIRIAACLGLSLR
jgi:hypothetical protein